MITMDVKRTNPMTMSSHCTHPRPDELDPLFSAAPPSLPPTTMTVELGGADGCRVGASVGLVVGPNVGRVVGAAVGADGVGAKDGTHSRPIDPVPVGTKCGGQLDKHSPSARYIEFTHSRQSVLSALHWLQLDDVPATHLPTQKRPKVPLPCAM